MKKAKQLLLKLLSSMFVVLSLSSCNNYLQLISTSDADSYESIAQLYSNASLGDMVCVSGTISIVFEDGYMIYDGANYLGVYYSNIENAQIGQVVEVKGEYAQYQSLFQIKPTSESVLNEVGVELPTPQSLDKAGIEAISADKEECGKPYNITVTLSWEQTGNYSNIEMYMDNDKVGRIHYVTHAKSYNNLKPYAEQGKTVNIDVVFYTNHATDGKMFLFYGNDIQEINE